MAEAHQEQVVEITPELKKTLMKNYFFINKAKFPSYFENNVLIAYLFLALAFFVLFYFRSVVTTYIFVVIFIIVAFFFSFKWLTPYFEDKKTYKNRPSTDQMENWLIRDIRENVKPKAVEMLSLNPATITPENFIVVPYPVYWETGGVPTEYIAKRSGGDYDVYATYKIQVLALSDKYVSFYTCVYNWIDNQVIAPYTLEFFFDDISSITTDTQNLTYQRIDAPPIDEDAEEDDGIDRTVGSANIVVVRNKSGEQMNVVVNIPQLNSSPRSTLKSEKVMQTLRIMLRHRRYGEEFEIVRPKEEDEAEA